jgi:hypothetical protein
MNQQTANQSKREFKDAAELRDRAIDLIEGENKVDVWC